MSVFFRNFEVAENENENEQIIDAERVFYDVTGKELKRCFASMPEM